MFEPIFTFFFIAIAETIISATWNRTYFKFGFPIYSKNYPFMGSAPTPISENILNEAFKTFASPSFVFKQIDTVEYAFREKLLQFRLFSYTPIMHGKLEINEFSRQIRVTGCINYWIIAFVMTGVIFFYDDLSFLPFLLSFLILLYFIQKYKYDKVGKFVYEWNSRKW